MGTWAAKHTLGEPMLGMYLEPGMTIKGLVNICSVHRSPCLRRHQS